MTATEKENMEYVVALRADIAEATAKLSRGEVKDERAARAVIETIDGLRAEVASVMNGLPYYTFSVHVTLYPGAVSSTAEGSDWVSALLTDNNDVYDWAYLRNEAGEYAYPRHAAPFADEPEEVDVAKAASAPYVNPRDSMT